MNCRLYSRIALNLSLQVLITSFVVSPLIAAQPTGDAPVKISDFVPIGSQNLKKKKGQSVISIIDSSGSW